MLVIPNKSFLDSQEIQRQLRSLYASTNNILLEFAQCSMPVKRHMIEVYCLNFYCYCLWHTYSKSNPSKIRVACNNIYRKSLGFGVRDIALMMFLSNRIDSCEAKHRKSCYSFVKRLQCSDNTLVNIGNVLSICSIFDVHKTTKPSFGLMNVMYVFLCVYYWFIYIYCFCVCSYL